MHRGHRMNMTLEPAAVNVTALQLYTDGIGKNRDRDASPLAAYFCIRHILAAYAGFGRRQIPCPRQPLAMRRAAGRRPMRLVNCCDSQ